MKNYFHIDFIVSDVLFIYLAAMLFMIVLFIFVYCQLHIVLYFVIYIVNMHHPEIMIVLFCAGNLANTVKAEVVIKRPAEHKGYVNKTFAHPCYIGNACLY